MIERISFNDIPLLKREGETVSIMRNGDKVTIYDVNGDFRRAFYIRRDSFQYREITFEEWRLL